MITNKELLREAKNTITFYSRHIAKSLSHTYIDEDDLLQEVAMVLPLLVRSYMKSSQNGFRGYFIRSVRNLIYRRTRQARTALRTPLNKADVDINLVELDDDHLLYDLPIQEHSSACLMSLKNAKHREITKKILEGTAPSQIAKETGVSRRVVSYYRTKLKEEVVF